MDGCDLSSSFIFIKEEMTDDAETVSNEKEVPMISTKEEESLQAHNELSKMEWTNELTMEFIQLYEKHPLLWNPKDPNHRNRNKLNEAWAEITREFSVKMSINELRKKKESLLAMYRCLAKKVRESETTGSGAKDVYVPSWFAYDAINRFIRITTNKKTSLNSEETNIERALEDETSLSEQVTAYEQEQIGQESKPNLIHSTIEDKCLELENRWLTSRVNKRKWRPNQADSSITKHLNKATDTLSTLTSERQSRTLQDRPALYGQLLAAKLRKLSPRTQIILQNKIDNLVFEAELSDFDSPGLRCPPSPGPSCLASPASDNTYNSQGNSNENEF